MTMLENLVDVDDDDLLKIDEVPNYLAETTHQTVGVLGHQQQFPYLLQPYAPYLRVT